MTSARSGTLYIVATPIGNLEDISLRALRVLREATVVAAEDTRRTRKLLAHHGIPARLLSLREHNELARAPVLVRRLLDGESIALVSDAGTPGLSDPGATLVRAAADAGVPVVPVPGASAVLAALVASGLPAEPVTFFGFLPARGANRRRALETARDLPHTLVLFEAPHRLRETLDDLLATFGDRRIAVARELTKVHEEVYRATLTEAVAHFSAHPPRGEFTLVIEGARQGEGAAGGAAAADAAREMARETLTRASAEGCSGQESVRRAVEVSGLRRNEVYRLWLAIKQEAHE
ncbi:MAG TPA: 16S rRNA (cytidine(1402)-2'-O)-methyltransferase [bacterium]|nr:16S rRNA (cytidine(1402)-2'-O)-methyltransferase [bacterium]